MDRIAPTHRPQRPVAGYQTWRDLLFLHWPVPQDVLRRHVPARLSLDLYEGEAYVGLVPFAMQGVRPRWAPTWSAFNFLETNVRTYVHLEGEGPGVLFFSLEAASWIAVQAARLGWGLPYYHAEMSMTRCDDCITYRTQRRGAARPRLEVSYRLGAALGPSEPGGLEHFFLERYLLYAERGGTLRCGQVHHTPYPVQRAEIVSLHDELLAAVDPRCDPRGASPSWVHYARGVDVEVFDLWSV